MWVALKDTPFTHHSQCVDFLNRFDELPALGHCGSPNALNLRSGVHAIGAITTTDLGGPGSLLFLLMIHGYEALRSCSVEVVATLEKGGFTAIA